MKGEGEVEEEEGEEEEELLDCHLCGKKVTQLDKHILNNHGEKVLSYLGFDLNYDIV